MVLDLNLGPGSYVWLKLKLHSKDQCFTNGTKSVNVATRPAEGDPAEVGLAEAEEGRIRPQVIEYTLFLIK